MKYFAYGSNMNLQQMRERCPNSKKIEIAKLLSYKLIFDGYSKGRKSSVANVVPSKTHIVWGVVFEVNTKDTNKLDLCEGVKSGIYNKEIIEVYGNKVSYKAYAYMRKKGNQSNPSEEYLNLIIEGARENNIEENYIKYLTKVATVN